MTTEINSITDKQVMTMIVREVYQSEWVDNLLDDEVANWSYEGAVALYDYYWDYANSIGEYFFLDIIRIRAEWTEYNERDARERFGVDHDITEIGLNGDPRIEEVISLKNTDLNTWRYLVKLKR